MIDSHTHLDFCEQPNEQLVNEALEAGVTKILTVGTDASSSRDALAAAAQFPSVFAAVGHHPNNANGFSGADSAAAWSIRLAPPDSTRVTTGTPNRSASRIRRCALR